MSHPSTVITIAKFVMASAAKSATAVTVRKEAPSTRKWRVGEAMWPMKTDVAECSRPGHQFVVCESK